MEQPIMNPPNPYVGNLRIFPGTLVKVSGRARPNATRFAINFQTGPSLNPRDDLALHLSPCFTPPRVVRNSLRQGAWGLEEAWGNGTVLNPHHPFEIIVLAEAEQFKIAINGAHYCEFRYRIPYQEISHLSIDGDLDIDRITITSTPAYAPSSYQPPAAQAPYPSSAPPMPTPSMYPSLNPAHGPPAAPYPAAPSGPYPTASGYSHAPGMPPPGPMPTGASYGSGYPQSAAYPAPMPGYPQGPSPTGAYMGGHPQHPHQQQPHQQPGHSSSPFGSLPIGGKALGTLAGLGLGAAAGAAVLSAVNPLKHMKKVMKPKKMFKQKGWGRSSSSSSNSSRSSFSSNSS